MWSRGEVVALRDVWFGVVWRAVAGVVAEDVPGRSVFWIPAGAATASVSPVVGGAAGPCEAPERRPRYVACVGRGGLGAWPEWMQR